MFRYVVFGVGGDEGGVPEGGSTNFINFLIIYHGNLCILFHCSL